MAAAGGSKRRGAGACWPWSLVYWSSAQPACGGGAKALGARGSVIRGGGFCRPPTPVPLVAASLSLLPSFALTALEESEAHPLLISKTLPTLFCLAICTYLIFCAQPASHAAHCSSTDRSFATPPLDLLLHSHAAKPPIYISLTRILRKTLHVASLPRTACGGPRVRWAGR